MNRADELCKKIADILKGIDEDECYSDDGWWEHSGQVEFGKKKLAEVKETIRTYLAAEPEAEPVAYINLDEKRLEWAVPFEFKSSCFVLGKLPLYLHPPRPEPARKPMTASDEQKKRLEEK